MTESPPIDLDPPFRKATAADAMAMAELMNMAGEGLPLMIWSGMAEPGESPWDVGRRRAQRGEGGFSVANTILLEAGGRVASALISYALPENSGPADTADLPAVFVALTELEAEAAGSWYINVLATYPEFRGQGHGAALIALAETLARAAGKSALSLIVSDGNPRARQLYELQGFQVTASRPAVQQGPNGEPWKDAGDNWLLMMRAVQGG